MPKLNKSFLYLFPLFYRELIKELQLEYKSFLTNDWLVTINNTFCYTDSPYEYAIQFIHSDKSEEIIDILSKSNLFKGYSDSGKVYTVLLDIPDNVKPVYDLFVSGKYSKFPEFDKQTILKFTVAFLAGDDSKGIAEVRKVLEGVLYRKPERAKLLADKYGIPISDWQEEWELSSKIIVEEETF